MRRLGAARTLVRLGSQLCWGLGDWATRPPHRFLMIKGPRSVPSMDGGIEASGDPWVVRRVCGSLGFVTRCPRLLNNRCAIYKYMLIFV